MAKFYGTVGGLEQGQIQVDGVKSPNGKPVSKMNPVRLTTPGGLTLVMGDTHALWPSHQGTPEEIASFDKLLEIVKKHGVEVEVKVNSADPIAGKGKKGMSVVKMAI